MSLSASFGESAHGETQTNKTVHGESRTAPVKHSPPGGSGRSQAQGIDQIEHNPTMTARLLDTP
jgi:hypothetical protein